MMNNLQLFLLLMLISTPLMIIILKIIFKKSIIFKISYLVFIIIAVIATMSFYIGYTQQFSNIVWTTPIGLLIISIVYNIILKNIKKLDTIKYHINSIKNSDLSTQVEKEIVNRNDEIGDIARAIIQVQQQQSKIMHSIKNLSSMLLNAAHQLSISSQQLSQNANEQSATTEEIATSMEQMLAVVSSNTQNAEITGKSSKKSANEIKQSNEIFVKTIKAVSEISEKISIITEIADKTDILSINASIEASRAGETGKGFAVVAHEIRELADKTKTASDKITELSQNGQDISRIAGTALEKVIPEIVKSAELVNNIVSASREQQNNIENINNSVQQLTEISNENSSSAEEMSVSAEELSAQAEQLKEMISIFKIGDLQTEIKQTIAE